MSKENPNVLVFASGTKTGGGSGFEVIVNASRANPPILDAVICGVVSNHPEGGVATRAKKLEIPFENWPGPYMSDGYERYVWKYKADFVMLSGWLKLVLGLETAKTVNIHPGPLPQFGGDGMHGHYVHEAVLAAYRRGEITHSAVTMHFVDPVYDRGPVFFALPVPICFGDTPEILGNRVNREEHKYQPHVLNHVVHGHVRLEGGKVIYVTQDLRRMMLPAGYDEKIHVVA